jgi:ketosteroid isomerase-like protein
MDRMVERRKIRWCLRAALALSALFLFASLAVRPAAAQKKKKDAPPAADSSLPLSDVQQVDYVISEMLGAWQLNDVDRMHKDYADDVMVVNGIYAPPVIGWTNYLATYQQQRARMQRVRLDRANTYIKVDGNVAWACYQWDFGALVNDQLSTAQGQTTLVLQKREGHWLIVLNHTSLTPSANAPQKPVDATAPKTDTAPAVKPTSR